MSIRVAVIDDSPLIRQVLSDIVKGEPDLELVATGRDGDEAIKIAATLRPDVMTLDVEMPNRTGLEALGVIMKNSPLPIVMVSTLTSAGATATLEALEKGAADFVCKPRNGSFAAIRQVREEILAKIRTVASARVHHTTRPIIAAPPRPTRTTDKIVVIAASTGGPKALTQLFTALPKGFNAPILVVQHMPAGFTESFAQRLDRIGTVPCKEAKQGDRMLPGMALLAPGGSHMTVGPNGEISLNQEPTIHGVRPAADYLFHSAAKAFGSRCVGVVLTGMGRDGAEGALDIKQRGGTVLGESESSCTIYGMPRAAKAIGAVHAEVPLEEMAHAILASLIGRVAHAS